MSWPLSYASGKQIDGPCTRREDLSTSIRDDTADPRLRQGSSSFVATDTGKLLLPLLVSVGDTPGRRMFLRPSSAAAAAFAVSCQTFGPLLTCLFSTQFSDVQTPSRRSRKFWVSPAFFNRPPSRCSRRRRPRKQPFVYHRLARLRRETRGYCSSVKWRSPPGTLARSTGAGERFRFRSSLDPSVSVELSSSSSSLRLLLLLPHDTAFSSLLRLSKDFASLTPAPRVDDAKNLKAP